jgi:hypothetical protein|tara:strand:- start:617 stop:745 length:129 start_codon:yes stop_codon:yes gene_type:complete
MVLISILIEKSQVKILFNNFPLKAINKKNDRLILFPYLEKTQ